ncbi:MAG TPA: nuclear transport factor 2 family protein [Pyrinomonadaceae bacterium]|jgi:ketosteroid isomerase-like protein
MTRLVLAFAAALLLASTYVAGGAANRQAPTRTPHQKLPPLPVGEKNFPRALAPVVEAEHAFARLSIAQGMKPAFLRYAAPDGVIFNRNGPVNAIETWAQRDPAPAGLLTWWPVYADVASSGDMGWTTGPYEFRDNPSDAKPSDTGHFFTVWRRQPDGSWKFVLDMGVRHPAPGAPETALQYPAWLKRSAQPAAAFPDTVAARKSLLEAERAYSEESLKKGARSALLARADETLRMYRQGTDPLVGRDAVARRLKVDSEYVGWNALKGDVSGSGDLGYAYGTYGVKATSTQPAERGHYARVWRHRNGAWRVVFQVIDPAPQQAR